MLLVPLSEDVGFTVPLKSGTEAVDLEEHLVTIFGAIAVDTFGYTFGTNLGRFRHTFALHMASVVASLADRSNDY